MTRRARTPTVQEARDRILDEHSENCWGGEVEVVDFRPVTWSQSFPDPVTHPEEAKEWFLKTINAARRDTEGWQKLAREILEDAIVLAEAVK